MFFYFYYLFFSETETEYQHDKPLEYSYEDKALFKKQLEWMYYEQDNTDDSVFDK